jgi:hypothetical protein
MAAGRPSDEELALIELDLAPNEASGLLAVTSPPLLEAHGWDFGFWVVLDEGVVHDCVALIGHRAGEDIQTGWEIDRLHAGPVGSTKTTEDAEALARHDGWVYVFGSHFGSKAGPLEARRSFVARFREADVRRVRGPRPSTMEVARPSFLLHRLVNDALREHGQPTVPLGPRSRAAFIEATIARGAQGGKGWAGRVRPDDLPLNVEGAAFRPDGSLLLGLRFPVAADGRPLLVDLDGAQRLFQPGGEPPLVRGFWAVDAIGRSGTMAGVRDMTLVGEELHLVTGNIDARDKNSVLLEDYPGGRDTMATHWSASLPPGRRGGRAGASAVREFPSLPRIEGIAAGPDGHFFYVSDEDEGVHIRHTVLVAGS